MAPCQRKFFTVEHGGKPLYFQSKAAAKVSRDESDRICIVMRGPDHWRGPSYGRTINRTIGRRG